MRTAGREIASFDRAKMIGPLPVGAHIRYILTDISKRRSLVSGPSILHRPHVHAHGLRPFGAPSTFEAKGSVVYGKGRHHIWDLAPTLHCSLIGTCLTTGELRQLFAKLDFADARTATDHTLHARAVAAAGKSDVAGKLLNKMLDKRHEAPIKRFARASHRRGCARAVAGGAGERRHSRRLLGGVHPSGHRPHPAERGVRRGAHALAPRRHVEPRRYRALARAGARAWRA